MLTENEIDARAFQRLKGSGAKIGSFLEQIPISCCIVINRSANFRGDRGVSSEMMRRNSAPYTRKVVNFPSFPP